MVIWDACPLRYIQWFKNISTVKAYPKLVSRTSVHLGRKKVQYKVIPGLLRVGSGRGALDIRPKREALWLGKGALDSAAFRVLGLFV